MIYYQKVIKMKKIKLIAFDIDGTLVPRGHNSIPQNTKASIKKLQEMGYKILLATGRMPRFIHQDVIETIRPDFYVTINGQLIVDDHLETIHGERLRLDEIHLMIETGRKMGFGVGLKYADKLHVYSDFDNFARIYLHGIEDQIYLLKNMENEPLPTEASYGAFLIGNEEDIITLEDKIKHARLSYSYPMAYEAFDATIGKAKAIQWVLDHYGIENDEVMAFGDADNDISMLESAGIGIAMGNAVDETKQIADFVTKADDDDGITYALKHYKIL